MTTTGGRLLLVTCMLLVTSSVAGAWVFVSAARDFFDEHTQRTSRDIAMYVAREAALLPAGRVDEAELTRIARQAMVVNPLAEVYVLNDQGVVVGHRSPSPLTTDRVALEPVHSFLRGQTDFPIYGYDPRASNSQRVFSAAEIRDGQQLRGYVYVLLAGTGSQSTLGTLVGSHILRAGAGHLAIIALLAILAAWTLWRSLTRPLARLHERVLELGAESGLAGTQRAASRRNDIALLNTAIESLAARLNEQMRRVELADTQRRDLFLSISHDLRTPLTAMRCALDALQTPPRAAAPTADQNIVGIALRHCDRLNRLIGQIFSLSRIDSPAANIRPERVELTELAQDIVSQFTALAAAKQVRLQLQVDPRARPAMADIGMIETVLQNVLENALRHTPPGGSIEVSVAASDHGIATTICDTGCGIPADDLERVTQRFTAGAGGRTGLGLAIVRRALELHGTKLRISSTPERGTIVSFVLPYAEEQQKDASPASLAQPRLTTYRHSEQV
jgi:signal transduction histidine kinase